MTATQQRRILERLIAELDAFVDSQPPLPQYCAGAIAPEPPLVSLQELARADGQVAA